MMLHKVSDSYNGLVMSESQAITWTYDGRDLECYKFLLDQNCKVANRNYICQITQYHIS